MKPVSKFFTLFSPCFFFSLFFFSPLFFSIAAAQEVQPLATFAPADSLATLSWSQQSSVFDTLDDDVNALEWQKSRDALVKLFDYLASNSNDEAMTMVWDSYRAMLQGDMSEANAQILEFCPAYQDIADRSQAYMEEKKFAPAEALLTVSADTVSPMPAVTALLRSSDPDMTALYTDMQSVLIECAQNSDDESLAITTLDQDGTPLYVVGDGGDFPLVGGNVGDLFFISSNPDTARSIVRKANGSTEDDLTSNRLYQEAQSKLQPGENNVGLTLDFDAMANLLESALGGLGMEDSSAEGYASTRAVAMLRTLGGFAGHISATSEGLVSETIFATNPEGGDEDLLKLINCATCKVSSPFLAPNTATSISSVYIPVRELIAYADSWVRGVSEASGEPTTLKEVLSEADVDIDTLLLDWIGSEAHTFVLEPFNTDAGDLLYGVPQVTVIPVSSPEAAQKGLDMMGETFWEVYPMLFESGFSASDLAGMNAVIGQFAVRPYEYNGTTINRVQYSFNGDLGYAFIGNYLVLGTPSNAIEKLIDTYQGSRTILDNSDYQAARERAPETVTVFTYSNDKPNYEGLADVLQLLNQPLAYGVTAALTAAQTFDEEFAFEPYSADLTGATAETVSAADGTLNLSLPVDSTDEYGYLTYYYELSDLTPGSSVSLNLLSEDYNFYPYISLVDQTDSMYIASGEYQDDGSYALTFMPEEGKTYWLEVSGSAPGSFTPYDAYVAEDATAEPLAAPATLEIQVSPEDADADGYIIDYYELTGVETGDTVEARLSSPTYYPSLGLIDRETGQYVASGAYQDSDGSYLLSYTIEEGKTYWLEVYGSLYDENDATYTLEVTTGNEPFVAADIPLVLTVSSEAATPAEPETEPVAAPTFAELLDAAALLPDLVRVLADHASTSESHSTIDGSTVYSRSVTYFRW